MKKTMREPLLCGSLVLTLLAGAAPVSAGCGTEGPTVTLTAPAMGTLFSGGETIEFAATATSPESGALPPSSFTWEVVLHKEKTAQTFLPPTRGIQSGSFTVPTLFEPSRSVFFRVHLTVRNFCGISEHVTHDVFPRLATVTLETDPPGLLVLLDDQPLRAPVMFTSVAGITRAIGVPAGWQTFGGVPHAFESWSDGGLPTHEIVTPAVDTRITATFGPAVGTPACTVVASGAGFHSRPLGFGNLLGPVTVQLAARPSTSPLNAIVGVSRGAAAGHAGFAALVRFNPSGTIDARNGANYAAQTTLPYVGGVTYNFRLVLNVLTRRYSVFVRPDGAPAETTIATDFAFRTEQGNVRELNHWGAWVAETPAGSLDVCDIQVQEGGCFTVSPPAWMTEEFADTLEVESQSRQFDAELDATPAQARTNSVIGLSFGGGIDYSQLACLVRFNPAGRIDARNGGAYEAASVIPYTAGSTYHFRFAVDVPKHTYSIFVRPPGAAAELTVGQDFAFRTEQSAVPALDTWSAYVSTNGHRTTVCGLDVSAVPDCRFALAPAAQTFGAAGGAGTLAISATSGTPRGPLDCSWTAVSQSSFITIVRGAPGRGDASLSYTVAPNAGTARVGMITVGEHALTVTQAAAAP
jgi:hypothetical protein